jgi:hypothetical protein
MVLDVWIAVEVLVPPAEDENAAKQKDDPGDSECDTQPRNASPFNHRYHKGITRFHAENDTGPFNRFPRRLGRIFQ